MWTKWPLLVFLFAYFQAEGATPPAGYPCTTDGSASVAIVLSNVRVFNDNGANPVLLTPDANGRVHIQSPGFSIILVDLAVFRDIETLFFSEQPELTIGATLSPGGGPAGAPPPDVVNSTGAISLDAMTINLSEISENGITLEFDEAIGSPMFSAGSDYWLALSVLFADTNSSLQGTPLFFVVCTPFPQAFVPITIDAGTFDLALNPISVQQGGQTPQVDSAGRLVVNTTDPITAQATIAVNNVDPSETRPVTITATLGANTISQTIPISGIPAAGQVLTFNLPAPPSTPAVNTLTISVDPTNLLQEVNRGNNLQTVQLTTGQFKLKVTLPDTDDQRPLNPGLMGTVEPSNFGGLDCINANLNEVKKQLLIQCVDVQGNSAPPPGCSYDISFDVGDDNGGHDSATHVVPRPTIAADVPSGSIPQAGATVTLTMPDVSGDVSVDITGTDPSGIALTADPLIFEIKVKNLIPIAPVGVAAPGLSFVVASHPGVLGGNSMGGFGTAAFGLDVLNTVSTFQTEVLIQTGVPAGVIASQGGSLYWGGLFDTNDNWLDPHCGHRDGNALDISWKSLTPEERIVLGDVVEFSNAVKFYSKEAPGTTSDHWHLMPRN